MKIVINTCLGDFSLSPLARTQLRGRGFPEEHCAPYGLPDKERNNPLVIQVVEELGELANGTSAELTIVEIPDDVDWIIEQYEGEEWVSETHRTWR